MRFLRLHKTHKNELESAKEEIARLTKENFNLKDENLGLKEINLQLKSDNDNLSRKLKFYENTKTLDEDFKPKKPKTTTTKTKK